MILARGPPLLGRVTLQSCHPIIPAQHSGIVAAALHKPVKVQAGQLAAGQLAAGHGQNGPTRSN